MTGKLADMIASDTVYDDGTGTVAREIFSSEAVYRLEQKKIFARAWHFICHESQLREAGDFFTTYMGEHHVIAVRDEAGDINVMLNTCPHRGNSLCRAEQGRVRRFVCTYHGWNFGLDGELKGVPGINEFYGDRLDKRAWGMTRVPRVASYKGFHFACFDEEAPELPDFLGWVGRLGFDLMTARGEIELVDGIQKNRLQCNWKLAVDNVFDWYHTKFSHGSALKVNFIEESLLSLQQQMVMLGDYGHAISGPMFSDDDLAAFQAHFGGEDGAAPQTFEEYYVAFRGKEENREKLGPVGIHAAGHPNIFPNLWIATGGTQLCLRIPRGPLETELWWFTFVQKDIPAETRRNVVNFATHMFGPAGLLEQDDGENWSHSTRGTQPDYARRFPLNFAMGMGLERPIMREGGQTGMPTAVNEEGQRWLYQSWQHWMEAETWDELRRKTVPGAQWRAAE